MSASVSGKGGPPVASSSPLSFSVTVQRHSRPPGRWRWVIIDDATGAIVQKSQGTFLNAHEAWQAGRMKLGKPANGSF